MSGAAIGRTAPVVVDDQLALLAALGLLTLREAMIGTPSTTYAWQLRLCQALVSGRCSLGALRRLVAAAGVTSAVALTRVTRPDTALLDVVDPRPLLRDVAASKVEHRANQLAAETIAAARLLGAVIRVSEGNSRGHLREQAAIAGVDFAVWRLGASGDSLSPLT